MSVLTVGRRAAHGPVSVDPVSHLAAALESQPATLVVEPPGRGDGFWAGGPSAYVAADGIYLAYRLRRPVVQGRGYANVVARSTDGVRFAPVATVTMQQFDCASLERPALVQRPDGGWRLYVSCSTPGSKHWWVEAVDADTPAGLSTGRRTVILPGDQVTAWKDVVVRRDGNAWQMWACRHLLDDGEDNADRMDTWYFTSTDGLKWTRVARALDPSSDGWDRRGARLTTVNRIAGEWLACYDGRASAAENWYERTGIAVGSPESFRAAAGPFDRGGRTLRYVSVVEVAGGHRVYFEADRPDGSNALYTTLVTGLG